MSNWTAAAEKLGLVAVVVSLLYVGYEIRRNNDLAVVESQQVLLSLNAEMKGWLVDKEIRTILFTDDYSRLPNEDLQTLLAMVAGWFDLWEQVFFSYERGVLSDEQLAVWKAGLCTFPPVWFELFEQQINLGNYMDSLVLAVRECDSKPQAR